MEILGYLASVCIGITLGLIGGGGSILTLPVLVYLFHISPADATSYSLFIVGISSLIGGLRNWQKKQVHMATIVLFAPASIITVFLTKRFIEPLIPETLFRIGGHWFTKNETIMFLFAILMIVTATLMIRPAIKKEPVVTKAVAYPVIVFYGVALGLVTGLLGAGGGFLLIPVLVTLLKLPIKPAIGTSLLIIALNSLIGFTGSLAVQPVNWPFLIQVTTLAAAGILAGAAIGTKVDGAYLKKGFGWFVLVMGCYIIFHQLSV